jgi:predicted GTPase
MEYKMANSEMVGSLADIERAIQAGVRSEFTTSARLSESHSLTSLVPEIAIPDYVEHRAGATEIGMLSAEAVVREHEAAAKEIESMSADLIECVKRCETVTRDAQLVTEELKEVAARYRAEAKRVFEHIENCSLIVASVREACVEMKDKIAKPVVTETKAKNELA